MAAVKMSIFGLAAVLHVPRPEAEAFLQGGFTAVLLAVALEDITRLFLTRMGLLFLFLLFRSARDQPVQSFNGCFLPS